MRCEKCKMPVEFAKLRDGKYAIVDAGPKTTVVTSDGDIVTGRRLHSETCAYQQWLSFGRA